MDQRKAVNALMLPATGNVIAFMVQTVARSFTSFTTTAGVLFVAGLRAPYLYISYETREFDVLVSCVDGYRPVEQRTSSEVGVNPVHDEPGVYSAALRFPPAEDEVFLFLAYNF